MFCRSKVTINVLKIWVMIPAILLPAIATAELGSPPALGIVSITKVFHNGEHNAFTDLVRFQDRYYLTFRSCPDGHMVHPTSSIIIISVRLSLKKC